MHRDRWHLREDDAVVAVEGPHLDEQLQDDDPEVEVEAADGETADRLPRVLGPIL
jgi:hypothetical protein